MADGSAASETRRVAVVTGGNKGIGFDIVRKLLGEEELDVVLTSRDVDKGEKAADELEKSGLRRPLVGVLDIRSSDSVGAFASWLEKEVCGARGLAVLVNNAGFAYKGDIFGAEEAKETLEVNLLGTKRVTEALLPLLQTYNTSSSSSSFVPRIVNVCSRAGHLSQLSGALQARVQDKGLDVAGVVSLGEEFVEAIRGGDHEGKGWSSSMYGVSKLLEIAYTLVLARQLKPEGILVHAVCPGWCKTDMSSHSGPRSAEKGAETPAWLATAPLQEWGERSTGGFFHDKHAISW